MKTAMGLMAGTATVMAALLSTAAARGEEAFSPRGYCRTTGGEVMETRDPAVYVCCYADRQRCIEVSELRRTSRRVVVLDGSAGNLSLASHDR